MRIYVSHASNSNYQADLYEPLIQALPNHELFLPHADANGERKTWDELRESDVVLAEVSRPSTGQGIELGWADSIGVPIIAIHRVDAKPSSAIAFVAKKITSYKDTQDLGPVVRTLLTALE